MEVMSPHTGMTHCQFRTAFDLFLTHVAGVPPKPASMGFVGGTPALQYGEHLQPAIMPEPLIALPHRPHSSQMQTWMHGSLHSRAHIRETSMDPSSSSAVKAERHLPLEGFVDEMQGIHHVLSAYSDVLEEQRPSVVDMVLRATKLRSNSDDGSFHRGIELLMAGMLLSYASHLPPKTESLRKDAEDAFLLSADRFYHSHHFVASAAAFELALHELLSGFSNLDHPEVAIQEIEDMYEPRTRMERHELMAGRMLMRSLESDPDDPTYDMRLYRALLYSSHLSPYKTMELGWMEMLSKRAIGKGRPEEAAAAALRSALMIMDSDHPFLVPERKWSKAAEHIKLAIEQWKATGKHESLLGPAHRFLRDAQFFGGSAIVQ